MNLLNELIERLGLAGVIIIAIIISVFMFSLIINALIRRKYDNILFDLEDRVRRKNEKFESEILNTIVENYKMAGRETHGEVNTLAIIEKVFNNRLKSCVIGERFINKSVGLVIILGLFGTFLGLTFSVAKLVTVLNGENSSNLESINFIREGLIDSVAGMALAFITSLFGVGSSVMLSIFYTIFDVQFIRESLMVEIEEYLDNYVALKISKDKETEYTMMNKILKETFNDFGNRIENSLKSTVENIGYKISNVVMNVELSSQTLDSTVEKFDRSLQMFSNNIKDFTEFNQNLKNNIERMDVNFIKFSESLTSASKMVVENYGAIESFSEEIKKSAYEVTEYNRSFIKDVEELIKEVRISVASIKELGVLLRDEMNDRSVEIKSYHEKFNSIISTLGEQIGDLGQKTSASFEESLSKTGNMIASNINENISGIVGDMYKTLESFKENEKLLAKTIAMMPEQFLTYNESAITKIGKQLDEIKFSMYKGKS